MAVPGPQKTSIQEPHSSGTHTIHQPGERSHCIVKYDNLWMVSFLAPEAGDLGDGCCGPCRSPTQRCPQGASLRLPRGAGLVPPPSLRHKVRAAALFRLGAVPRLPLH